MVDQSAQEDEILALHSIYEEEDLFMFNTDKKTGTFFVKINSQESTLFNLYFGNFFINLNNINEGILAIRAIMKVFRQH